MLSVYGDGVPVQVDGYVIGRHAGDVGVDLVSRLALQDVHGVPGGQGFCFFCGGGIRKVQDLVDLQELQDNKKSKGAATGSHG